jgi:hypothetical protein
VESETRSSIGHHFIDELDMGQKHPSAAIALQFEVVQDFLVILSCLGPSRVFLIQVADHLTASKTSYWDYHFYRLPQ